jgi:AraC family transcriptional regulator
MQAAKAGTEMVQAQDADQSHLCSVQTLKGPPNPGGQTVSKKSLATVAAVPTALNGAAALGNGRRPSEARRSMVGISPVATLKRRLMTGSAMTAELVQSASRERVEYRYRGSSHLLVAWEQGVRHDGETFVEDTPRSTLRNLMRKMTFVPAGRRYFEWHQPRTPTVLMYFYIDAAELAAPPSRSASDLLLAPRLHFEAPEVWSTVLKLKGLIENPFPAHRAYFEALGAVLVQELLCLDRWTDSVENSVRGGLAAWQQRIVATYIEEHLAEQIPLAALARLARLSPYHFSRAFKQSFGVPPHRYHTSRRIEHAKALLGDRTRSVTDIGLTLGFGGTSSFTTAFRRTTGLTPSRYHRSLR